MAVSEALVPIDGGQSLAPLPDLKLVEIQVREAAGLGDKSVLEDTAKRAEAQSLYERRKGYADREAHFARLRVICEAGIAVVDLDEQTDRLRAPIVSRDWVVYASLLERGVLLDELLNYKPRRGLGYGGFAGAAQMLGYYWVPGKALGVSDAQPWWKARALAKDAGIPLESLPPDPREYRLRTSRGNASRAQMRARQEKAMAAYSRVEKQRLIATEAKRRNARVSEGYSLLRKTLAAFQAVSDDDSLDGDERRRLNDIFRYLHGAEDSVGAFLRVGVKR